MALLAAITALLLFLLTERRRGSAALVPLDLFSRGRFVGVLIATAAMTFGMYGVLFLLPLRGRRMARSPPAVLAWACCQWQPCSLDCRITPDDWLNASARAP